jgi:hypothetical protein
VTQASIDQHQVSRIPTDTSLAPSLLPRVPSAQLARRRRPPRRWDLEPETSKTLDLAHIHEHTYTHERTASERQREREKGYQIESWQKRSGRIHEGAAQIYGLAFAGTHDRKQRPASAARSPEHPYRRIQRRRRRGGCPSGATKPMVPRRRRTGGLAPRGGGPTRPPLGGTGLRQGPGLLIAAGSRVAAVSDGAVIGHGEVGRQERRRIPGSAATHTHTHECPVG